MTEPIEIEEWKFSNELILSKKELDFLNEKINGEKVNSKIEIHPKGEDRYLLKATSWVGTIKIPNSHTIIIRPKVGNLNFIKMLAYTEDLRDIQYFDLVSASEGKDLVDFMAKLFLDITKEIVEEGIYKSYLSVIEEIPTIKGRLLLAQNIRRPRFTHEKFWCEYDELSSDILENQIILYCADILGSLVKTYDLRTQLYELHNFLEKSGVSSISLEQHHLSLISFQKLNEHYEKVLSLCEFILKIIWYGDFTKEEKIPIYGFLYDMNNLFQSFVTKIVEETFTNYRIYPELRNKDMLERIDLESDEEVSKVPRVNLKPDIVIKKKNSNETVLILDTKYKEQTSANDIYQAIAYSMTFDCKTVLLVPQIEKKVLDGFRLNPELEKEATVLIKSIELSDKGNFIEGVKNKIKNIIVESLENDIKNL